MALGRSSRRPTIWTSSDCRAGMSKALIDPLEDAQARRPARRRRPGLAAERDPGQGGRLEQRQDLGDHQDAVPVPAVDEHAGHRAEEEGRGEPREADHAEQPGGIRAGEAEDQPAGRQPGHPGADEGHALAGEEEAVVPVRERPAHRRAGADSRSGPASADAMIAPLPRTAVGARPIGDRSGRSREPLRAAARQPACRRLGRGAARSPAEQQRTKGRWGAAGVGMAGSSGPSPAGSPGSRAEGLAVLYGSTRRVARPLRSGAPRTRSDAGPVPHLHGRWHRAGPPIEAPPLGAPHEVEDVPGSDSWAPTTR